MIKRKKKAAPPVLFITYLSGIFDEVDRAVPGIKGLSFVDCIACWAEGKGDQVVTAKLLEAAAVSELAGTVNAGWASKPK